MKFPSKNRKDEERESTPIDDPIGVKKYYPKNTLAFNMTPIVDMILIGFFFTLNSLPFFIPSGVDFTLPESSLHTYTRLPTSAVLTVKNNQMILFQGYKLSVNELSDKLKSFLEQKALRDAVLLVKADKDVTAQELITICSLAKSAGFSSVQVATETRTSK